MEKLSNKGKKMSKVSDDLKDLLRYGYRPYDGVDEFRDAMKEHGTILCNNSTGVYYTPLTIYNDFIIVVSYELISEDEYGCRFKPITYKEMVTEYIWEDGNVPGVEKS